MRMPMLIAFLFLAGPAFAGDGDMDAGGGMAMRVDVPRGFVNCTNATVLASPGYPAAIRSTLPAEPMPITWPLPSGPLIVLGLPAQDDMALTVMEATGLLEDPEDLAGGYGLWAWNDGKRPVVVVLAADAAALFAARFEFEQSAPAEMINPSMRNVNVKGGDGSSAVLVRRGHREHRPARVVRGWFVQADSFSMADSFACAGANLNHLWITEKVLASSSSRRALRRVQDFGVELTLSCSLRVRDAELEHARSLGVRNAVISDIARERLTQQLARTLKPQRIFTFAKALPDPAHLIPIASDERIAFHLDVWNRRCLTPHPAFVPTVPPSGQTGSVLMGDRFELERLASLWDAERPVPNNLEALEKSLLGTPADPAKFVQRAASQLREAKPRQPWVPHVADHLEAAAKPEVLLVPVVPAAATMERDPVLDEPAWAYAARRTTKGFDVLVLSDGAALHVAVRLHATPPNGTKVETTIVATDRPTTRSHRTLEIAKGQRTVVLRRELSALHGPAHVGRVLHLDVGVHMGPAPVSIPLVIVP